MFVEKVIVQASTICVWSIYTESYLFDTKLRIDWRNTDLYSVYGQAMSKTNLWIKIKKFIFRTPKI